MILVDTNILAYLLISGDKTAAAQALFELDSDWQTEPFALVELSNLLATMNRTGRLSAAQARRILESAEVLVGNNLRSVAHRTALDVAAQYGISAYDARFVALAEELGLSLVSEDAKLRRAVPARTQSLDQAVTLHAP